MRFEWDDEKNESNQRDHDGLSFEVVVRVFADEFCLIYKDRVDEETGEQRWHAIGYLMEEVTVLVVVHVYREDNENGEEIIRIISGRAASNRESRRYFEQTVE